MEDLQVNVSSQFLTINFSLPYAGVVDFSLKKKDGNILYRNYYLKEEGENRIMLKIHPLSKGEEYDLFLLYKGSDILHSFEVPIIQ